MSVTEAKESPPVPASPGTQPTHIVGVRASAGGLEALERMFKNMPSHSGLAFVIVQHLSPDFRSLMDELMARWTTMPIHRVVDGVPVEANSIYLIPPKKEMVISDGRLRLEDKDPEQGLSLPIDHFLKSLARERGPTAIAVILSGTGSDDSRGVEEIKRSGGLVIVQSEHTAKFDGMPHAARETGAVDLTLDPEDIGAALVRYAAGRTPAQLAVEFGSETGEEEGLNLIFRLLRDRFGIDFSYYKLNTIVRRTERRLQLARLDTLQEYVQRLAHDDDELDALYRDLLVGVTSFFRDADAYRQLAQCLDELIATKQPHSEFRAWVAGCGTGEEAYSIAILLHERLRAADKPLNLRIFATDVHQRSLITAGAGLYSSDSVSNLPPDLLSAYFTRLENGYAVKEAIRHLVVFAPHNVIKDAPFTRLDLISCRNLLIYLQPAAQRKALSMFHFGLRTGGLLFLGPSESPGELEGEFEPLDWHWKIFRKRRDVRLPIELRQPVSPGGRLLRSSGLPEIGTTSLRSVESQLLALYEVLLVDYMPPALLISAEHELLHVFGDAGRFLKYRSGRVGKDVLELLEPQLRLAVAGAIQQVQNKRKPQVTYRGLVVPAGEGSERISLTVRQVQPVRASAPALLVVFESLEPVAPSTPESTGEDTLGDLQTVSRSHIEALEAELRYARENLQATIEELETSNEELQATNQELVASNEELQSTNEELHSVNEELYTVNAEHQRKIQELSVLSDDMENLLASTQVHTIFLDRELRIRKFTPAAAEIFHLLPHDLGRPFNNFAHRLRYDRLEADLQQVLQTGQPLESEVQDQANQWYLLRILPYQSKQSAQGVLLTLVEITALKLTQQELMRREFELRTIADHVPSLISYVDATLHYRYVNRQYQVFFGKPEDQIVGHTLQDLHGPENFIKLAPAVQRVLAGEEVEFEHYFTPPQGRPFWALVTYIPDRDTPHGPVRGFFVCKNIVTTLKEVERRFERAVRGTTDGIWDWNIETGKVYYSPRFVELLGFDPSQTELLKAEVDRRIHPDDVAKVASAEQALLRHGTPMDVEFRLQCNDGTYRWFRGRAAVQTDASGRPQYISGSIQDIEDYHKLVQAMQRQVEQRDRFLAMLSHELRNPLGAVVNACRILQRANLSPPLDKVVETISRQSQQMSSLLEDLLDVARITEGKVELKRKLLDLRDVVPPAVESVQHLLDARRQRLELQLPPEPMIVSGDEVRLRQVLANLLSNASKYSPPTSCVRVVMQRCDQQVELRVIDEGEGIPPDFLRRIFEPFEQLGKRVERTGGGLGLGLTVAEFLIRLHEGKIEAYSRGPGRGSEFVVRLPLVEKAEMATETPAQDVPPRLARRVVIVEDNRDARETLQWLLEDDGYEVVTAETGPEGLRLIRAQRPDVAIVDIGLPEMDGFAVAQAVRADPQLTNTYLIALTGYGQQEDRQAAFAAGFQAHLTKPVDLGELERIIRYHFAAQEKTPPQPA